jgi:molecular chaperone GrpE
VIESAPSWNEAESVRAAVREEFDEVVPHLVAALKRNDGVADLVRRLDDAERRLGARDQRPLVARLYRLVGLVRRLDLPDDVRQMLLDELLDVLRGAGYSEFGAVGEPFDPLRHQALDADVIAGAAVVASVYEPGLETLGEVVTPARVRVGGELPADRPTEEAEQ